MADIFATIMECVGLVLIVAAVGAFLGNTFGLPAGLGGAGVSCIGCAAIMALMSRRGVE